MQYVLVTGGVLSGLGKGVVASSIGVLLKASGLHVTSIKIDPYLNIDAGTMSPFEHGEVFVLDDGSEVDLDLGNYERFLGTTLRGENNITTGKMYQSVIEKERRGDYLGKTVQVVPHITNEIMDWIEGVSVKPVTPDGATPDICVIELGGTIGDIESMPFVEAMRQFQFRVGVDNICVVHVSLVPQLSSVGEQKTKPTQHSVRELRALGLAPDVIVCRSEKKLEPDVSQKIASFCHVKTNAVIGLHNVNNLYKVPLMLRSQVVDQLILSTLGKQYDDAKSDHALKYWREMSEVAGSLKHDTGLAFSKDVPLKICLVGKYTGLADSYASVLKALNHAAIKVRRVIKVIWIEAEHLEGDENAPSPTANYRDAWAKLKAADGILVPGGFGSRGVEGKVLAAGYARKNNIPYLGICLGMQVAVIEFARSVLKWPDANSTEFNEHTEHPVVMFMPEIDKNVMGGNMRLGGRPSLFVERHRAESKLYKLYGEQNTISERHRHRYEVVPEVVAQCEANGMIFVGIATTEEVRNEMLELQNHPFFVGVQFHPEFKTTPFEPSPPFFGFISAANKSKDR